MQRAPRVEEPLQVGGSTRENIEFQDGPDGVVCAPDGHRHTQACIYLPMHQRARMRELMNTGINAHTDTQMHAATRAGCDAFLWLGGTHRP